MNNSQPGFTLLEVLIAMAIFAIMSVMAYGGLRLLLDARTSTAVKSERLAGLQMTLYLVNEDLAQIAPRSIRDDYGAVEPVTRGGLNGELFTLTRSVPAGSNYRHGSQLQRVSYRFEDGALYRLVWTVLDRTQQTEFRRRKLINLEHIRLRFFDSEWTEVWSVPDQAASTPARIPKAVEIIFTVAGLGDVPRLFFIHD
jgi:general secretion pathway protein J